jgi:hypothetical protein
MTHMTSRLLASVQLERWLVMPKQKMRFERVPLEIVKKIIEIESENTSEPVGGTNAKKLDLKTSKVKQNCPDRI